MTLIFKNIHVLIFSIYTAVINVFKGEGLLPNELYCLNENTRRLLRTDMGFFIKEYFQNQILTKGLSIILDEIQKHEGETQDLFVLTQVWDKFFTEILPTLQAILYPLQELTVRQMALLGFRDLVLMKFSLDDLLRKNLSLIPASITQMLLVLQVNVNCKPMLNCHLYKHRYYSCLFLSSGGARSNPTYGTADRGLHSRGSPCNLNGSGISHYISEGSLLSPVVEQEGEMYLERVGNLLRHSMTNAHSDIYLKFNQPSVFYIQKIE
uniref:Uncharacterized protein n=1 Tax=Sinocyclocheilus rhinocerous TaxID=307959 RepID=A0A673H9E5_9TELE